MSALRTTAEQILARRVLMRRRFMPYIQYYRPGYKTGWVHQLMARRLERFSQEVIDEKSPRLMMLMPPRHGKSTQVSIEFPGWHLGRAPTHEFISASYNVSLPEEFSRDIRARLRDPEYQALFPDTVLNADSQGIERWKLSKGGGYLAAGVGGGITGKGAHILSIDDPVKNAEEADSMTVLDAVWAWYGSTAYTRLAPGGGVLITQTWWADADLAGRLQEKMQDDPDFDQFEIIKFPAIAEEDEYLTAGDTIWRESSGLEHPADAQLIRQRGDPLHAERYTLKALLNIKKTLEPRHWSALYQQNPTPDEGLFFPKETFYPERVPILGESHCYQAWDLAITEKQLADWTVGVTGKLDVDDTLHAVDQARFRCNDGMQIVEVILDQYEKYRPLVVGIEDGAIWRSIKTYFLKRCQERRLYPMVEELKAVTDKAARARPLQGRMVQGKVVWPTSAPWFATLQKEFIKFLNGGTKDDQVDAWAWLVRMLMGKTAPNPPVEKKKGWREELEAQMGGLNEASHMAA